MNITNLVDLKIVLIEPSGVQLKVLLGYLEGLGITHIIRFETGQAALAAMRSDPPDLVVSALYLPDMTGTDVVYAMRADTVLRTTAFILMSSETQPRYLDPIRQAGTIAILPKPFSTQQLQNALLTTLDYLDPHLLRLDTEHIMIEHLRVLLVDDSLTARGYIKHILQQLGIQRIDEAGNGREAISLIEHEFYDLVVTDYNMPEMDGQALTEYIRGQSGQSSVPILMVSSESNQQRLAAVEQAGVSAICDKPFDPRIVRDLIAKMLASG
ncbi:response regulator [Chitinivorax sp. PXF-14]|uniref:response regulator n=1 Tax=Chitinivorax sp. PXF-14 TaxID=3230488 RepID=UPI003464EB3A